jgi:hypothetical protein
LFLQNLGVELEKGDELGVFADDVCVGGMRMDYRWLLEFTCTECALALILKQKNDFYQIRKHDDMKQGDFSIQSIW